MEAHPECSYCLREPAEDGLLQVSGTGGPSRRPPNYVWLASPRAILSQVARKAISS